LACLFGDFVVFDVFGVCGVSAQVVFIVFGAFALNYCFVYLKLCFSGLGLVSCSQPLTALFAESLHKLRFLVFGVTHCFAFE
jgi:hypothetical protein